MLGYYSWGSNDLLEFDRHLGLGFVPGAIGATFVSTDARTFHEPPASWTPGKTGQSLIGDLIRDGITGVAGHVAEPYLNATIRPDILFPAYVSGMNLAESFYLAMPFVGWQTVVIGDPLCAPFRQKPLAKGDIDAGIDEATELPAILSQRKIAVARRDRRQSQCRERVRERQRSARPRPTGLALDKAFEEATKLDPGFWAAQFSLATLYEALTEWDAAIDRYRMILDRTPNNVLALNNLAYVLAVQKNEAADALPLAHTRARSGERHGADRRHAGLGGAPGGRRRRRRTAVAGRRQADAGQRGHPPARRVRSGGEREGRSGVERAGAQP